MLKYLLAVLSVLFLNSTALAIPIPGMNTFETHCISYRDFQADPIKEPGVYPSAHLHTHYGIVIDQNHNPKPLADQAQGVNTGYVQNLPGGGQSAFKDPGYEPLPASCFSYGEWAWYAIPTPLINGVSAPADRSWTWPTFPQTVGVMTLTWAAPIGVPV